MSQNEAPVQKGSRSHPLLPVFYVQAVCVAVLLLGLVGLKFLAPTLFSQVREFYEERFLTETSIEQVFGAENDDL